MARPPTLQIHHQPPITCHLFRHFLPMLAIGILLTACAGAGVEGTSPRRQPDVITAEEVASSTASTAHDAVRELRQEWLRPRGPMFVSAGGPARISVAVDGMLRGDIDVLHSIHAEDIVEIRFHGGSEAMMKWGMGHEGGVIEVITRG